MDQHVPSSPLQVASSEESEEEAVVEVPETETETEEDPPELPPETLAVEVTGDNLGARDWPRLPEGGEAEPPQQGDDQSVPDTSGNFLKPEESEKSKEECPVAPRIRMQVMEAQNQRLKFEERSRSPGRSAADFLTHHTERAPRLCSQCRKPFSCSTSLGPQPGAPAAMPYQCEECGKFFAHLANLRVHERGHVAPKASRCLTCKISFAQSLSNLAELRRSQQGKSEQKDSPCGKGEGTQALFPRETTEERPHKCSDCGKCFEDESSLHEHENIHRRRTT